ncbi:hypothetical protein F5Y05DRAFT_408866 [Hypoxylon sp. FL0543]|nr:hypothetical protein F5Y05DRAFT_408866 [Hypoxylon sp. FL0543]
MLSAIGRAATRRLISAPASTSSYRIAVSRLAANPLASSRIFVRTVTRATKKDATTTKSAAKPAATKGRAKQTTKAKASQSKAKTAKSKPKAKSKSKTAAKSRSQSRAKPGPKRKKALSPEKKAILERKELKKTALFTEPKPLPDTPWIVFVAEHTKNKSRVPGELRSTMAKLSQDYKALPASERQRLVSVAEQNKLSNAAAYKAWVESHTPVQMHNAIKARASLKRKYNIPTGAVKTIRDDRLPKKAINAYSLFTRARWASGDFANSNIPDASKQISRQWKALPETERHAYEDLAKSSMEHYEKEVESVLHRQVQHRTPSPA